MYVSTKVVAFGTHASLGDFVIIKSEDYPNEAGMRRTTYCSSIDRAKECAMKGKFECAGTPDSNMYVGVEVSRYKKLYPYDCITTAQVLAQYTARQRDDDEGRQTFARLVTEMGVDIFKDPELKKLASELWTEAVRSTPLSK